MVSVEFLFLIELPQGLAHAVSGRLFTVSKTAYNSQLSIPNMMV